MTSSLAVTYRPRRFADVAGQRHIRAALTNSIRTGNIPHQLLLAGGSGLGKTTMARLFAAALFCPERTPEGDACGVCPSCLQVTSPGSLHPDVIEMDAASYGGKDDVRDIATKAALSPMRASHKLYIIDEAHGLSTAGAQAFLRLLEEPPPHVIFALATTDPHKLPSALRGRCLQLEVLPLTNQDLLDNLTRIAGARDWVLPPDVAQACIDATDPALGVRGVVMSLEKIAPLLSPDRAPDESMVSAVLGVTTRTALVQVTTAVEAGDPGAAFMALQGALAAGSARGVRDQLVRWARTRMLAAASSHADVVGPFERFELLVTCGTHPGALEVCVVQAAANAQARHRAVLPATPDAGAQSGLPAAAGPPPHGMVAPHVPARATAPAPATQAVSATRAPAAPPVRPSSQEATAVAEQLFLPDARLVGLLNALSRRAPAAAALVRRASVQAQGDALTIMLSDDLKERVARSGLTEALEELRVSGVVQACVSWQSQ